VTPIDKIQMHGQEMMQYLDGGSALHLNLEESLTKEAYFKLLCASAKAGCNYWCVNVKLTICNECEHIDKRTTRQCSRCHSENVDHATRVIGYLKRISSFSSGRQAEAADRFYHRQGIRENKRPVPEMKPYLNLETIFLNA
jgi:ribonucleoside-triphosphate reductase